MANLATVVVDDLSFGASALATILFGPQQQLVILPPWLRHRMDLFGAVIESNRLFLIALGGVLATLLSAALRYTLFGARVRAAVDSRRAAEGIGIGVERLFMATFALGAAMTGLGGALAVDFLGLDPTFPFKYLIIVLMVVAVGGPGSITGSLLASVVLGVVDAAFKYAVPEAGPFVLYAMLVGILLVRPRGFAGRTA